ncbi:MAG: hypothetical protein CFE24_14915 [Flavobacterium sp. BFFFF2]|nr:MAG: hypothetical protein CFE24_14915 [Flavobacterium sp. BFFFF2]
MNNPTDTNYSSIPIIPAKIVNGILVIGGVFVTYKLAQRLLLEYKKSTTQSQVDDSPSARQAIGLRSAINPSGISWFKSFDTTSVSVVLETAKSITNLDQVAKDYSNLFGDNLLDDLQSELSASEYQTFLSIVASNPKKQAGQGSAPAVEYAKASSLVVAKKEVTLRTTPDASNHGAIYEQFSDKNIIRLAKPGEFLGYATGRQQYDQKNNVKFIEVAFVVNAVKAPSAYKDKNKLRISFWVSSSSEYVDIFPFYKNMYDAYPATTPFTGWMKPQDFFTLKGLPSSILLTLYNAPILNEQLMAINLANANTLLGEPIMSLQTTKGEFTQFRTVDNTLRWVEKKYTTILTNS